MGVGAHGSARWANLGDLKRAGLLGQDGLTIGYMLQGSPQKAQSFPARYRGNQHLITVAPNRTGKGTSAIIPALLDYRGTVLCIDPKGENAFVTAEARVRQFGQTVKLLDPWNITAGKLGMTPARFNPLSILKADSSTLTDDAELIADALVVPSGNDDHWSTEAKALILGFILHVVTSEMEEGRRHLPRVRDILCMNPEDLEAILDDMADSKHGSVRRAAGRYRRKEAAGEELASVVSTAYANTHFLDSEAIRQSLYETDFRFENLKSDSDKISVYLILPADRLRTHGRWLRLMVSMSIKSIIDVEKSPKQPALFILDEFAALGHMAVIEQAFGLMAGFGMQMWAILQDLSQLKDIYNKRWPIFIANAGVFQIFGTNDIETAEYISKRLGNETRSETTYTSNQSGGSSSQRNFSHPLMSADEILRLSNDSVITMTSDCRPIFGAKFQYYINGRYFYVDSLDTIFRPLPNFKLQEPRAFDPETALRMYGEVWKPTEPRAPFSFKHMMAAIAARFPRSKRAKIIMSVVAVVIVLAILFLMWRDAHYSDCRTLVKIGAKPWPICEFFGFADP